MHIFCLIGLIILSSKVPYLSKIYLKDNHPQDFPFSLPFIRNGLDIRLKSNVTFFVGENGIGKSTLLEAIADKCNFNVAGGNRNHNYDFCVETLETADSIQCDRAGNRPITGRDRTASDQA